MDRYKKSAQNPSALIGRRKNLFFWFSRNLYFWSTKLFLGLVYICVLNQLLGETTFQLVFWSDFLYLAKHIKKLYIRFGVYNNKTSKNLFFHFSFKIWLYMKNFFSKVWLFLCITSTFGWERTISALLNISTHPNAQLPPSTFNRKQPPS